ncbi:ABC transporter substrate-binding protein [Diplocloster hominis]|uniref:ABC transporter substrate-binding protein n=1 Tax=Diplocloster hominis TaxID=3079010 RepID=UPI0031BA7451
MCKWKKWMSLVLATAMIGTLTACGSSGGEKDAAAQEPAQTQTEKPADAAEAPKETAASGEKVKLNMLFNDTDENVQEEMKYVMEHLPEVLPNVEVELEMSPGDAQTYETKVRTMIAAGGEGLDVWWERGGSWATPILESKSALPLDDYLEASGYWDKVIPSAKLPAADGHTYGIPFEDISYEIMLYNKKIFADNNLEVPKTVTELKKVVETLAKTEIVPISVGAKDGWCAAMMVEGFAYSIDPEITKKIVDGQAKFSDEPYTKGAEVMKELMDMGAFSKNVALTGIDEALPLFETGKAAMMANGSWAVASCADKMGEDFGYFYYPVVNDADVDQYGKNCAGGVKQNSGMMVYAGTEHPDEAVALCQAVAELRCKYVYEEKGNPFTVYKADVMGWKYDKDFAEPVAQLAADMQNFGFVYGLVQDVMPTAAASSGVMQATSKFMTNTADYGVEDYLADMDKAALEE